MIDPGADLYKAMSQPLVEAQQAAGEILTSRTVRMARSRTSTMNGNLTRAREAFERGTYNDAVLEMKLINQLTLQEYLSRPHVKNLLGFAAWVKLLDSDFGSQLDILRRLDRPTAIALAIVDYYARHCPLPQEPDMDVQELLLALFAFKAGQEGLSKLLYGPEPLLDQMRGHFDSLGNLLDMA
jgi:hypothetical protein